MSISLHENNAERHEDRGHEMSLSYMKDSVSASRQGIAGQNTNAHSL